MVILFINNNVLLFCVILAYNHFIRQEQMNECSADVLGIGGYIVCLFQF